MAVIQDGAGGGNLLTVNSDKEAMVALTQDAMKAGFARILDTDGNEIVTTENGAISISSDNLLFCEQVDGSALNTNIWTTSTSGMTVVQASGFITLNSALATTGSAYAILNSVKYLPMYGHLPMRISINAKVPIQPQSNLTMELGIGLGATTSAPTDGAFFRWSNATQFLAVINNGGTETTTALSGTFTEQDGSTVLAPPTSSICHLYDIVIVEDVVQFYVDDVLLAEIDVPEGFAYPTNSGRLPLFARVYNSAGAPSNAPQISIGQVIVVQEGMTQNRPWGETLASIGRGTYQSPITTFAQTANHANSTSPSSATLSNTAAGYTTLGGRYQFAAPAGAATDFALFAYQVPAGYQLFVTGISISSMNTGAAVAITSTVLDWGIGVNSSAVSLATADGAGTWAPRRIPLGLHAYQALDPIGQANRYGDTVRTFNPPLVIDGGRYFHVIVQVPVGTATGSQVIRGDVTVSGYFE